MYYRLLRLLLLNITPLFVFDGPRRPNFKRNANINTSLTPTLITLSKKLLKLFGLPFHTAPGEAEAECALLNRAQIVDAVLSEDVDTLMFGAHTTIRNWSSDGGSKRNKSPTHVTVYQSDTIKAERGLTREGIVLIALMSGGDYLPTGVRGCGIKTAVEAARAGFGEDLYKALEGEEDEGVELLGQWRERLQYEMETNESGWFKRRNGKARIPDDFPNRNVLEWYARPVVSSKERIQRLRDAIVWDGVVNVAALREYTRETFEWRGMGGAAKFTKTLAPVMLARRLWDRSLNNSMVEGLHGKREHCSTDGCAELRISYIPVKFIPINKEREAEDDELVSREQGEVLVDDDELAAELVGEGKQPVTKEWDPNATERMWILEGFVARSMPNRIRDFGAEITAKPTSKPKTSKSKSRKPAAPVPVCEAPLNKLDSYLKATKNIESVHSTTVIKEPAPKPATPQRKLPTKNYDLARKQPRTIDLLSDSDSEDGIPLSALRVQTAPGCVTSDWGAVRRPASNMNSPPPRIQSFTIPRIIGTAHSSASDFDLTAAIATINLDTDSESDNEADLVEAMAATQISCSPSPMHKRPPLTIRARNMSPSEKPQKKTVTVAVREYADGWWKAVKSGEECRLGAGWVIYENVEIVDLTNA
jgi:Holliday junction resolvase YEN1